MTAFLLFAGLVLMLPRGTCECLFWLPFSSVLPVWLVRDALSLSAAARAGFYVLFARMRNSENVR